MLVGYARVSTEKQDLRSQKAALRELGVDNTRIYVDHGLTGTTRDRPGLREALAACRPGDTLIVTKLDRLARSISDARSIADELTAREVKLSFSGSVYDPTDPMGKLVFNMMGVFAEFEADLIRQRTREGLRIAKANGRLKGKPPKLSPKQEAQLVKLYDSGEYSKTELAEMFAVARSTVGRAVDRSRAQLPA
jgi:DNA invertase Pin-like site-specific DNA recombinase